MEKWKIEVMNRYIDSILSNEKYNINSCKMDENYILLISEKDKIKTTLTLDYYPNEFKLMITQISPNNLKSKKRVLMKTIVFGTDAIIRNIEKYFIPNIME